MEEQSWKLDGRCRAEGYSVDTFYSTGERGSARVQKELAAQAICFGCVVARQCLEYALAGPDNPNNRPEEYGVWGGATENDRRKARRAGPNSLKYRSLFNRLLSQEPTSI